MPSDATASTLLLTNREKPIIINSVHRGRGARICGSRFPFLRVNPLDASWNQTGKRLKQGTSPYSTHERVYFSWLSDAETLTGASPSLLGRLLPQSPNSSRLCTSISYPPPSTCALHGCGNGPAGTRIPSTSPSPSLKLGALNSNPPCKHREAGFEPRFRTSSTGRVAASDPLRFL